jgi:hypothetical protein
MLSSMPGRCKSICAMMLLGTACFCGAENRLASKSERIGELISQYEKYGYINGAVLVAEHGKVIYAKGIGDANMESHTPNTPRTRFGIASITKQFTAALVLQQAAEGKIRIEGKITDYLPWYRKDTGDRMTIEQLLHHTSGLPPDFDMPEFSDKEAASRHYEPQDFAEKFCQPQLTSEPGAKWEYRFVTKIASGEPGAGNTLAEMRGDMPGNFFSWILRYPEQNDLIIVFRNSYGSTERLEQNIQAILFDQQPKMPSRSPKDLAARAWQVPEAWVDAHGTLSVALGLIAIAGIWWLARRTRRNRSPASV